MGTEDKVSCSNKDGFIYVPFKMLSRQSQWVFIFKTVGLINLGRLISKVTLIHVCYSKLEKSPVRT